MSAACLEPPKLRSVKSTDRNSWMFFVPEVGQADVSFTIRELHSVSTTEEIRVKSLPFALSQDLLVLADDVTSSTIKSLNPSGGSHRRELHWRENRTLTFRLSYHDAMIARLTIKAGPGTLFTFVAWGCLLCLPISAAFAVDGGLASRGAHSVSSIDHDEVLPVLLLRCSACHGLRRQEAGLDVRSRESLLRGGKSGPAIVPGNAAESLLIKRLRAEQMPPRKQMKSVSVKPMLPAEIETVARWIDQGAREPSVPPDVATSDLDPLVSDDDRDFWSFRPPRQPAVPEARLFEKAGLLENPIDAFILQKLVENGGTFSPPASRQTLIRRACYDLTGLPPTPEEVAAFLADDGPQAYGRLIDRLLASPRYGERWARFWLDLAGYADSEGVQNSDRIRPEASRYRDYVIRALNEDKPYDQFLLEQIAGDELVDYQNADEITQDIYDKLVATGFLRMTPDGTYYDITNFLPDRLKVIADQMEVLTSATMGLTMSCARCHDHKYDPIPQRDYYRLVAVFKGATDEHDWMKPVSRYLPHVTPVEKTSRDRARYIVQHEINTLNAELATLRKRAEEHHVDARLESVPEELRDDLRKLLLTPKEQRTDTQIALAARYEKELHVSRDRLKELDKDFEQQVAVKEARIKELSESQLPEAGIRAAWDRGTPSPTYILQRGDHLLPGRRVGPGVPSVLTDGRTPFIPAETIGDGKSGRRLAFARWLTRPDHPLTARVMVNRIWKHHFEHGIVQSTEDFGAFGVDPTHPELLDWLAVEFVRRGWSIKQLHRLIMTSRTYQQSSAVSEQSLEADPDNELLSRMPLRRLEAEAIRDALLFVSGRLDDSPFGPADSLNAGDDGLVTSASRAGKTWRRSIYVLQRRTQPLTILENFDLPTMNPNCTQRMESTVVPQALHLLNNQMIHGLALAFAERVVDEVGLDRAQQVDRVYRLAFSRPPTEEETARAVRLLDDLVRRWREHDADQKTSTDADRLALGNLCHAIMNSAEFLYVD
jgi:hypothetical protein